MNKIVQFIFAIVIGIANVFKVFKSKEPIIHSLIDGVEDVLSQVKNVRERFEEGTLTKEEAIKALNHQKLTFLLLRVQEKYRTHNAIQSRRKKK